MVLCSSILFALGSAESDVSKAPRVRLVKVGFTLWMMESLGSGRSGGTTGWEPGLD